MPETDKEKEAKKAKVRPAQIGVDPNIKPKITKKTGYAESSASVKDRPFQMYENPDYLIQNKVGRTGYWNAFQDYLKDYKLPTGESYIGNESANRNLANDYTNLAISDYNKSLLEKYKDKPEVVKKMAITPKDVRQVQEYYRQGDPNVLVDEIIGGETSQFRYPSASMVDVSKAKEGEFIPMMYGGKQYVIPAESYNRGITSADFIKYDPNIHANINPNYIKTLNSIRGGQAGGAFVIPEREPTNITPISSRATDANATTAAQGVTAPQGAITAPKTITTPLVSNKKLPPLVIKAGEGTNQEQEKAYLEANNLDENWQPKKTVVPAPAAPLPTEAPVEIKGNFAKGGSVKAPKMKKYAVGGEIAGYNYQGQPIDRYGKVIENEGMSTEDVGKSALDILTNAAGKIGGSKTTTTGNANASSNATSDAANSTQSGSTESGGLMNSLGGKSAAIGAATDLGVAGAGLGAAYIDSKNKDARGRYKNVESSVGSSALKGAALGTKIGANPALVAATGGLSILAGAGLGALGGGIYGGVEGQKDVASIKTSKAKMANELSQANAKRNQQRAIENRDAGILEGNLATPLTEGEAIYNEKDELINAREGGIIGAAKMMYAKGGTIVGKGGPKDDAIFTKANKEGIAPGSFIVPAENEEKAKGIRAALFGNRNQKAQFKKGGETESNVAVSNGEHLFTPKERKKIINYLGEEILEELAPNAEENSEEMNMGGMLGTMTDRTNMREYVGGGLIKRADGSYSKRGLWDNIRDAAGSNKAPTAEMLKQEKKIKAEYYNGGIIPEDVATQKRTEQIQDSYAGGGTTGDGLNKGDRIVMDGNDATTMRIEYDSPKPPRPVSILGFKNSSIGGGGMTSMFAMGGTTGDGLSKSKAKIMLHEGMANGKPITEQQRKYFGWVAGGSKEAKMDGGDINGYAMGTDVEGVEDVPKSSKTYSELITPPRTYRGTKEEYKAAVDKSIKEGKTIPKDAATTTAKMDVKAPSVKGSKKVKDMTFEPMERRDVALEELRKMDEAQALGLQQAGEKDIIAKPIVDVNATYPTSPKAPSKGLMDYAKRIDPGAAFSAYQIMQGSKLLKSGQRPEDVSKIDPAFNAAVERAQRDATFGYTPEQAAMLDQKAINALNDARFAGRNLAGGSAGTAFQQERQAINQGWSNALQLKSADQQLRMQKQQYADQAVKERANFLDMQRRRAFGDAMTTYDINQESGSALVGAGVRNAIGAFRYQKELDAQERAAKIAGTPIKTT